MATRIIYRIGHASNSTGHGGSRRVAQVVELLQRHFGAIETGNDTFGGTPSTNLAWLFSGANWGDASWSRFKHPKAVRNAGILRELSGTLAIDDRTVVVFDSWLRAYAPMFDHIRSRGGKVAVFPQNIDSLTSGRNDPMSGRIAPDWFLDEVRAIGAADLVCCISREEQWLLSMYGVNSEFLPYFPPAAAEAQLAAIRARRQQEPERDSLLILGSALNTPTFDGMKSLVSHAQQIVAAAAGRVVNLVGFGTEVFRSAALPAGFEVLGSATPQVLEDCMVRAHLALCFQPGATGALTRISELLLAGIPVVANPIAARSHYNLPGMHVVEDIDRLLEVLRHHVPAPFNAPGPPAELESILVEKFRRLVSGQRIAAG